MNRKTKTKKPLPKLPEKPSELLRLAVKDARAVSKMKTRKLDMNWWHDPIGKKCVVCMAGAVMDRTLRADPKRSLDTDSYPGDVGDALERINAMRIGFFRDDDGRQLVDIERLVDGHYDEKIGRAPWRIYLKAADMLEAAGL